MNHWMELLPFSPSSKCQPCERWKDGTPVKKDLAIMKTDLSEDDSCMISQQHGLWNTRAAWKTSQAAVLGSFNHV